MITYEQIQKANEGLKAIDVKGKKYVMVNEKVKAFRMLFPEGFIRTDLVSLENGVAVMQSRAGYYENGSEKILGTGMAFERQDSSFINKTSYIENCETSAIGRALSFLSLGADDSIASAEELANAIMNQNREEFPKQVNKVEEVPRRTERQDAPASVSTMKVMPNPKNSVKDYIANEITFMKQMFGIVDTAEMNKKFMEMRNALIKAKIIDDVPSDKQTMEQAENMIDAIYKNFMSDKKDDQN